MSHIQSSSGINNNHEKGVGKLTLIVFGTLVFVLVYCTYYIAPFYYYYYELQNQFEGAIKVASTENDKEIRKKLMYHIKKMQIPMAREQDLKITRDGGIMRISLDYKEVFYITWQDKPYDIHVFPFHAYAEGRY